MRRELVGMVATGIGAVALALGLILSPMPTSVEAAPLLQPSPRPELTPSPEPPPPPTATAIVEPPPPTAVPPPPTATANPSVPVELPTTPPPPPTATPMPGRVTGTVIDLTTGAPAPMMRVQIGDVLTYTDSNGNYDVRLKTGVYRAELILVANQGTSGQPAQEIEVGPGDTVILHLFFYSPESVAAPPTGGEMLPPPPADNAPELPVGETPAEPAPVAEAPPSFSVVQPAALPSTSASFGIGLPWVWMLGGAILLGLGALVQMSGPRRRVRTAVRTPSSDEVLQDLLERDLSRD